MLFRSERISRYTNTQTKVSSIDLHTINPRVEALESQCRTRYKKYFFEGQTNAFSSLPIKDQRNYTRRRKLDKDSTVRNYLAYAINPNDGLISEEKLFDRDPKNPMSSHLAKALSNDIKDLIIPHNFMEIISELIKRWRKDDEKQKSRDYQILGKKVVKDRKSTRLNSSH